jgi:hypothetical protein
MTVWYSLCSFGTFFPVLVPCTKKKSGNGASRIKFRQLVKLSAASFFFLESDLFWPSQVGLNLGLFVAKHANGTFSQMVRKV